MAYNSDNRSERLLQGRRFTTDNLTLSQEAFTNVLDLGANEILTDDGLIPTGSSQLPYSGSSQNLAIVSASVVNPAIGSDLSVLQYYWRKKLKPAADGQREVYYFTQSDPATVDDTVTSDQLIETDQQTNFVSPKYIIAADSVNTTESTTPGYKVVVYKSTASTAGSISENAADPASYVFDYKTGIVTWNDGSAPAANQYVYVSTYQYVGRTLRSQLDDGSISGTTDFTQLTNVPTGLVSSSAQISITESQISDLTHYVDADVLTYINGLGVVSGSTQISYLNISDVPAGIVSSSTQIEAVITNSYISASAAASGFGAGGGTADFTELINVPSGLVSSSAQISITESQISDLTHYTDSDVKTKLNVENVVSSSLQVVSHLAGKDVVVKSLTAETYIISSSITHMTTSFSSGSTIFGDDITDTHQMTGSLYISGSIFFNEIDGGTF